ncbi:unnamed protein product [Lota lota]
MSSRRVVVCMFMCVRMCVLACMCVCVCVCVFPNTTCSPTITVSEPIESRLVVLGGGEGGVTDPATTTSQQPVTICGLRASGCTAGAHGRGSLHTLSTAGPEKPRTINVGQMWKMPFSKF